VKPSPWLSACVIAGSLVGEPVRAQPARPAQGAQLVAAPASASAAGKVSLRLAFEAAWRRAVGARESDGQRLRAQADLEAAGSLWSAPPVLELSHRDDRLHSRAGKRESEIGVALALWLPGQRAARFDTAEAAAAQAGAAQQLSRLRLAGELREAAWLLAALQAEASEADAQVLALKQLADDVDRRVRAGDLARADALAAQAEKWAATAMQLEVRQRLQAAGANWTQLTGLAAEPDLAPAPAVDEAAAGAAPHAELQLASLSTQLARKRLDLVRTSRRDAPEVTVGLRQDLPGRAEASQGSLVVGLRLPFGTDDRNKPLEAAARAELDLAESQERMLRERLDSDLGIARSAQRIAEAQLAAETARARLLRERATLIEKSFRAGETALPELLRALNAAAHADSAVARQTAALGLARARIDQTLGLLP
jgi:outer membrane protein, heavy metal efflux system